MFKIASACSQEKDTPTAVEEVLAQAFEQLGEDTADLALVFASYHTYDHPTLVKTFFDSGKLKNLIGGTTSGEICNDQTLSNSLTLMLLSSPDVNFKTAATTISLESPMKDAQKLGEQLKQGETLDPKLILLMGAGGSATPFLGDAVLAGLQNIIDENIPIVGGGAGDEMTYTEPTLYFQNEVLKRNQAVAVAFYGDFNFGIGARHGWEPIGRKLTVNKSEGFLIQELEGKKPRDLYVELLGETALAKLSDPKSGLPLIYPLGIEVEGADELLIRTPVIFQPDGSVVVGGVAAPGQSASLAVGSREKILEATNYAAQSARDMLGEIEAQAVLFFDCVCRKMIMGKESNEEVNVLHKYFPSVPTAGLVTYGEFAPLVKGSQKSYYHNQSAVVVALA